VLALAAAALAATPKSGAWSGKTSQSLPVTFQVSRNGQQVLNFEAEFSGRCTKSGAPTVPSPDITTDAGRTLTIAHGTFSTTATNGKIHKGSKVYATASDKLSGRFTSSRTARGTYSVTFTFNSGAPEGLAGYHCTTGTVTWTATRG
jgi:hypothetical protein